MQRPELGKGSSIVALKVECDLEKQGEVGIVSAKYLPAIKCYNELTRALIRYSGLFPSDLCSSGRTYAYLV
jgi:hypothetical protein